MPKWLKIVLSVLFALMILLVGVRWALTTDWVRNYVKNTVISVASSTLNGELHIDNIRGDLFKHIVVQGIKIADQSGDAVLKADSIIADYNLWSLLGGGLKINEISVYAPELNVEQYADSTWNILKLLPVPDPDIAPSEKESNFPVSINLIRLQGGSIGFQSATFTDSDLSISNLDVSASFDLLKDGFRGSLKNLSLTIRDSRFDEDIRFEMEAGYDEGVVNLDKLVLFTGSTLLDVVGTFDESTTVTDIQATMLPLSWRDVANFTDSTLFVQNVELRAGVTGSFNNLNVYAGLSAHGLESFDLHAGLKIDSGIQLTSVRIEISNLDATVFTGDQQMPKISRLEFGTEGLIDVDSYALAKLKGSLLVQNLVFDEYSITRLNADYSLDNGDLLANLSMSKNREHIHTQLTIGDLFERQEWGFEVRSDGFNPGFWADDTTFNGWIQLFAIGNGEGFTPGQESWSIESRITKSSIFDLSFDDVKLSASITKDNLNITSDITMNNSAFIAEAYIQQWLSDVPSYNLLVEGNNIDARDFTSMEDFTSSIQLSMSAIGSGIDPQTLTLKGTVRLGSSDINGAKLDSLTSDFILDGGLLKLTDTKLASSFAKADLRLTQNITDIGDIRNQLDFALELLDIGPLAPITGAEVLSANGKVSGTLRTPAGRTNLNIRAELNSIVFDTLFVDKIDMVATVGGTETFEFESDTRVSALKIGQYILDDLWVRTYGSTDGEIISGQYRVSAELDEVFTLSTLADYELLRDTYTIQTSMLQLKSEGKSIELYRPFRFILDEGLISIDPVYLRGSTGVEVTLGLNQPDMNTYQGFLHLRDLDLAMSHALMEQELTVDGYLTGDIEFDIDLVAERYDVTTDLVLSKFNYKGLALETITLDTKLSDGRLTAQMNLYETQQIWAEIVLDVPFLPGNPTEFDDDFFDQPVMGQFKINETNLTDKAAFLLEMGLEGTTGNISASGTLAGTAGSPEFIGEVLFGDGRLSGVPIDHFDFGWQFHPDQDRLALTSRVVSSGQEVAYMSGTVPFQLDWRTFNPIDLGDEAQMDLAVKTTGFNLTALNQFLDRSVARNLNGVLTMDLGIRGYYDAPQIQGHFQLVRGNIMLVENNIVLRNIESNVQFERDRIRIQNLSMQSGGTFRANGEIILNGFVPDLVSLNFSAQNFRVYDTRDIQALISMRADLTGSVSSPELKGNLTLERGFLYLDNFGERTVEEVLLDDEEGSVFDGLELWNNTTMELKVTTDRNFWVRNRARPEIQLQLNGELDLVKSRGQDIEVFGRMGVNDGYVMQLGKRFTFDQGDVVFSGPPANPQLQIKTLYALRQPSDIKIWYVIGGTAENPTFSYESDPEMELQDIISYTVFGRPFHSLMAWEQTITGRSESTVADAAVDILLDRVEQLATDRLGIDLLQIENTRASGSTGTTIKAGKFISNRLFVAILQELGNNPLSQVIIEYQLKRNLELIVTGSDSYHTGVDVRWKYDY